MMLMLALVSMVTLLTRSRVFSSYRSVISRLGPTAKYFSSCPTCTGFWVGVVYDGLVHKAPGAAIIVGLVVSLAATMVVAVLDVLTAVSEAAVVMSLKATLGEEDEQR